MGIAWPQLCLGKLSTALPLPAVGRTDYDLVS